MPHAFDRQLYGDIVDRPANSCFIIRSFGDFYGLRRAEPLIDAIRILVADGAGERLTARVFRTGSPTSPLAEDPMLRSIVRHNPRVDYIDALQLMVSADLLVVVDSSSHSFSPYLPAKLIDYLGAGTRVLAVCDEGETSRLTERVGGLVASASKPMDIARAIRTAINERTSWRPTKSAVVAYDAVEVAAQFQAIVDQLKERS